MDELLKAAKTLEATIWQAELNGDSESFLDHVYEDAVIIRRGKRYNGLEYSGLVSKSELQDCEMTNFEVVYSTEKTIQTHYTVKVTSICSDTNNEGLFDMTSTWHFDGENWGLIFNMDSRKIIKINV